MSIADIFESGERKRQKGHFRNLVLLARADNVVTEEEQSFLVKMGSKMGLTESQIAEIKDNPKNYPINPPVNYEDRVRRLVELVEMVCSDGEIIQEELDLINRFGFAIGCRENQIKSIVKIAVQGFDNNLETSEIVDEIVGD